MDSLQRFIFERADIRGEVAHVDHAFITIVNQRNYPPAVKTLIAEALIACLLLAGSIKFKGEMCLQFQGDKRLPLLLIQCTHELQLRGFAKYGQDLTSDDYQHAFLQGQMVLTINQYNQTQSYQSVIPITKTTMADNLIDYFAQSEQIATHVWLAVGEHSAAGMLLQLMPNQDNSQQNSLQRENFWSYATCVAQTITEQELLTLPNETLLHRLYHETNVILYPERIACFKCRCNREKIKQVLSVLGAEDVQQLVKEQGEIKIDCDFCHTSYKFDAIDTALLFYKR